MRAFLALIAFAALGACHHRPPPPSHDAAAAPAGPALAAGFWQQTVSDRHGSQITRLCLDAGAAHGLASFDHTLAGHCSQSQITQATDGSWRFSSACDMGQLGKVSTNGVMRGDFARRYTVDIESQRVGATAAANGPAHVTAEMRRLGDCPKDLKPGDVILPGNIRARLDDLSNHA